MDMKQQRNTRQRQLVLDEVRSRRITPQQNRSSRTSTRWIPISAGGLFTAI